MTSVRSWSPPVTWSPRPAPAPWVRRWPGAAVGGGQLPLQAGPPREARRWTSRRTVPILRLFPVARSPRPSAPPPRPDHAEPRSCRSATTGRLRRRIPLRPPGRRDAPGRRALGRRAPSGRSAGNAVARGRHRLVGRAAAVDAAAARRRSASGARPARVRLVPAPAPTTVTCAPRASATATGATPWCASLPPGCRMRQVSGVPAGLHLVVRLGPGLDGDAESAGRQARRPRC